jgi:hypothetical protein
LAVKTSAFIRDSIVNQKTLIHVMK